MLPLAAVAIGALIGFVGSRTLRRPAPAPAAVDVARPAAQPSPNRPATLTAPELQQACLAAMVRHVRAGVDGRTHAPNRYLLQVHTDDLAVIDQGRAWFVEGLEAGLRRAATDNGWVLDEPIDIRIEADLSRRAGVPNAKAVAPASASAAAEPAPAPAPAAAPTGGDQTAVQRVRPTLALVRTDSGERTPLGPDPVSIGRAATSSILIDDTRVSRSHAQVAPSRGGWALTDLGSSNGTAVNGHLLTPNVGHELSVGDRIGIGPFEFQIEAEG